MINPANAPEAHALSSRIRNEFVLRVTGELVRRAPEAINSKVPTGEVELQVATLEIVSTEGHAFGSWHAEPLLVLDVYEHAFAIDMGSNKGGYLDAFFRNVKWSEVATRATRAIARLA
ncbi:MAG: Fe-Mn family superoxide dismutase [Deltaproteobacteria bacterium]